ncbi:Vacuolar protein-sorting-associated protein 25 [Taphrina deformans PYCC 5710]|uniref:Vacuolar protein-sorting-associated protein 25 n=1 Tax=Taphrina deformans (strain PYCC 5710 / ATCC 11124 / CBS 356.35 / IMI 108563 / JCM 9778 / NBRC 8474) TaxID=1097556 RepID=R4X908_TAPDE|nr:Vacuolar protein-sorting-associated protein 25 [Taphrina deformans PYCC 5710]|eukprot:CCG82159.1 Vacuolar protein-sorting-associated protein 25 [Taphrina deformans PYCC 5710]
MTFELPPIHSFPPFFTRQPNVETFNSQRQQWAAIILEYYRHNKLFQLSLNAETINSALFTNRSIKRSLKLDTLMEIIEHMVAQNQAEWLTKKKGDVLIYWRRPEDWAQALIKYVEDTGQNGSILTMYELTEAEEAERSEFYKMDKVMLRKVVDVLSKRGKAVIMKGSDGEEQGIKFL